MNSSDFRLAITSAMRLESIRTVQHMRDCEDHPSCTDLVRDIERNRDMGLHALDVLCRLAADTIEGDDYKRAAMVCREEKGRLLDVRSECLPLPDVQELEDYRGCRGERGLERQGSEAE
ncbi:MAG TPA: hypothetical protein VFL97_05205 [Nitrococcus sp.]|nr:hypothetical protein [Nitrococcus sp.]